MNKVHKLVWSTRVNGYVVTSEAATAKGCAPSGLSLVAMAAGLASVLVAAQTTAAPVCAVSPSRVVSADTTGTVTTTCPNEVVTVNASIDVAGGTGLNNNSLNVAALTITGAVRGQNPIELASATLAGSITNSGTIASYWSGGGSGFGGPALALSNMTVGGSISNSGTIDGDYAGVSLADTTAPLLVNSGTINSMGNGLSLGGTTLAEVRNETSGTIHGDSNAGITVQGASAVQLIDNRGTISSFSSGVLLYNNGSVASLSNAVGATISGQAAVRIGDASTVTNIDNAGRLEGTSSALVIYNGDLTGTLRNRSTGVITGGSAGISMGTYDQSSGLNALINEGMIEGSIGIDGHEGSVISQGIINSGIIRGTSRAISLIDSSSILNGIVNSGTLQGEDHAVYVQSGSSLDRLDITGKSAALLGDVDAAGTDINIKSGAVFSTTNAFNTRTFTVESGAELILTAAPHTTNGLSVNGITVAQGFLNQGKVFVGATTVGLVNSTYAQSAGSTLQVGVNSVSTHGTLAVSGNATLAQGTTLKVAVGNGASFNQGDRVQGVITSGGTLSVNLTPVTGLTITDNSLLYNFLADTSRASNELDLVIARDLAPFTNALGLSRPVLTDLATNLDQILANGVPAALQPVFDQLTALPAEQLPAVMGQLVPAVLGAGSQAGVSALRSMNKIIQSRIESNQGLSAGNAPAERFAWVRAFGTSGDQTNQGAVAGFRSTTGGLVLGADAPISDKLRAGLAFTYARSNIDSRDQGAPSSLDVDTYELIHYGSYNLDARTDLNYQIDVGQNEVKGIRQILFMNQQARSKFSSTNLHGSLGLGRTWGLSPHSSVTPSVRMDYTHMKTGSYTETGANALNLKVGKSTFKEVMLTADVKGTHNLSEHTKLVGNVSAGYDFANKQTTTASAFVGGGTVFESKGLRSSPWLYRTGVSLLHDKHGMEYSLRYDLERRTSGYTNQTFSARVRWAF